MSAIPFNKLYDAIEKNIKRNLSKAVEQRAQFLADYTKNFMPVLTGSLKESVGTQELENPFESDTITHEVYVGTSHRNYLTLTPTAEYAIPVELKHHFFEKAVMFVMGNGAQEDYWRQLKVAVDEGFEQNLVKGYTYEEATSHIGVSDPSTPAFTSFERKYNRQASAYRQQITEIMRQNRADYRHYVKSLELARKYPHKRYLKDTGFWDPRAYRYASSAFSFNTPDTPPGKSTWQVPGRRRYTTFNLPFQTKSLQKKIDKAMKKNAKDEAQRLQRILNSITLRDIKF